LEIKIGVGANGSVFRVSNIKTKEIKALKALLLQGETSLSSDLQIGMKLSRSCDFLVRYENVFIAGDFQCIVMEYFEQGDLQKYLNSGYKLNENVFLNLFNLFFYIRMYVI
jgi:serine/threonine protein kinase